MLDLRSRIDGLEADVLDQENQADELEHTGKGKKDAITKVFNAIGRVPAASRRRRIATKPPACATNCVNSKTKTI